MKPLRVPGAFFAWLALCAPLAAAPANYAGANLSGKDLHDANLNGANFEGANLQSANLTDATCRNANFHSADLTNANLTQAVLDGADLTGVKLKHATLHDARLHEAKLAGVEIPLAGSFVVDVSKVNNYREEQRILSNVERVSGGLSFEHADLRNTLFTGNAEGVDFRFADLRGADLSKTSNLDKAHLKGARYDAQTRWGIDPAAMGAVLASADPATAPTAASASPFTGKWIILKEHGATETGVLKVSADGTYQWDYSAQASLAQGTWGEAGGKLRLQRGELGRNWTVTFKSPNEILLESEGGSARTAVRSSEQ